MMSLRSITVLAMGALSLLLGGCAMTYYHDAGGTCLLRITVGTDQAIGPVEVKSKAAQIKVGGATTAQGDTAAKVAEAIVEAANPLPSIP